MLASQQENFWRVGPGLVGALVVIGVATGRGVTTAVGCVLEPPWVVAHGPFPPLNVTLSAVFLAFACAAAVSTRQFALGLMAVEFAGFVTFLFFLRGGYAVGISGTPMSQVVQYDVLGVAGRVGSLGLLAFGKHPDRRLLIKVALIGVCAALLIVATKAALFPLPAR
jgi:hypothetical protein